MSDTDIVRGPRLFCCRGRRGKKYVSDRTVVQSGCRGGGHFEVC